MISSAVFIRYARALVDVAMENNEEPQVTKDLQLYREIFIAVPDLLDLFHSPAVPRESKEKILADLLARYPVLSTTANFLKVALAQNRLRYFHEILDWYVQTVNKRKGIVTARVTAASALNEERLGELRASLAQATGLSVNVEVATDPELLGGLVVQVGSTVYDGSIRRQLAEIRQKLGKS